MAHRPLLPLLSVLTASSLSAQVPPGHLAVAWRDSSLNTRGIDIVDPAGAAARLTGLDPLTIGTQPFDGLQALLATDDGLLFVGLGVDNTGAQPAPLTLRLIVASGTAAADLPFATLMQVAPGDTWAVTDIKERSDGSLLVAASQVVLGSNPMPNKSVFLVDRSGVVQTVPTTGIDLGGLLAIADCGDRFVVALDQSFFVHNVELQSLRFDAASPPFQVTQLVAVGGLSGLDRDVNGELVFAAVSNFASASVKRVAHAANATPLAVPNGPIAVTLAEVNPGSGVVTSVRLSMAGGAQVSITDSVLGGTVAGPTLATTDLIAISGRDNPAAYGLTLLPGSLPMLGSQGALPALGNGVFALRMAEPSAQAATAFVGAGVARTSQTTPFGTLLVDPSTGIVGIGFVVIPAGATGVLPLPLPPNPGLRGLHFPFQALVVTATTATLSNGLDITLQ